MLQLPETVQIGPVTYTVKEEARTATEGYYGQIIFSESMITLTPGMSDSLKLITLWHEILHALLHQAGLKDHDEHVIVPISFGIVDILENNPQLRNL